AIYDKYKLFVIYFAANSAAYCMLFLTHLVRYLGFEFGHFDDFQLFLQAYTTVFETSFVLYMAVDLLLCAFPHRRDFCNRIFIGIGLIAT
ncbi:hypothetical protein PFISCL1PPCAC_7739, partial [Pristionchus fissidentatus]